MIQKKIHRNTYKFLSIILCISLFIGNFFYTSPKAKAEEIDYYWVEELTGGYQNNSPAMSVTRTIYGYRFSYLTLWSEGQYATFFCEAENVSDETKPVTLIDITFFDINLEKIICIGGIIGGLKPGEKTQINASVTAEEPVWAWDYTITITETENTESDNSSGSAITPKPTTTPIGGYIPGKGKGIDRNLLCNTNNPVVKEEEITLKSCEDSEDTSYQWYYSFSPTEAGKPVKWSYNNSYTFLADIELSDAYYYCRVYKEGYIYESYRTKITVVDYIKNIELRLGGEKLIAGEEITIDAYFNFDTTDYTLMWFHADKGTMESWRKYPQETERSITVVVPDTEKQYYQCLALNKHTQEEVWSHIYAFDVFQPEESASPKPTDPLEPDSSTTPEPMTELTHSPVTIPTTNPAVTEVPLPSKTPEKTSEVIETLTPMPSELPKIDTTPEISPTPKVVEPNNTSPALIPSILPMVTTTPYSDNVVYNALKLKYKITKKLKVRLTWKKTKNIDGFVILRAQKANGKYKVIKKIGRNKFSYQDKTVKKGKTYYYKVYGYQNSYSSDADYEKIKGLQVVIPYIEKPNIVLSLKKDNNGQKYVQVKFKKSNGRFADIYVKGEDTYIKLTILDNILKENRRSFSFSYQEKGMLLSFKARTYIIRNGKKYYSPFSKIQKIKTR